MSVSVGSAAVDGNIYVFIYLLRVFYSALPPWRSGCDARVSFPPGVVTVTLRGSEAESR